ncbi:Sucrose transport protein SUT2 [Hibiscus syriacus]|uniref:Sucrose transport protein SUT2 n=1 Tax=Hibiscus syriacus TaxID=106335 RepID=A0A6A2WIN2_HIBSY|nr:sucrose transport protein SUC4-like [Hibiscus syriacus]KAE8659212.1 Sucrose transport protein SUT2 [Hibiscus syriacus]
MATPEVNRQRPGGRPPTSLSRPPVRARIRLRQLFRVASVACGIQFGWALQLSLLTPYVQELGIPHQWASIIWLCGPLSGLVVQPLVGHMSDRCNSRFGRRRPFIVAGAVSIIVAVLIIGHSADIGWLCGDTDDSRPRAIVVFVFGFWILDVANNVTQGPCRALLADLTEKDHRRTRVANAYFSLFMAIGNILGYATGSYSSWFKIFPFSRTAACNVDCANLKCAFYLDVIFIALTTYLSVLSAKEVPLGSVEISTAFNEERPELSGGDAEEAFLWELFGTFRYFSGTIWIILSVIALNWIGWFPFLLFDTDWMGREIYGGKPNGGSNYAAGVRMGALGLMLNSVVLGITSVLLEKLCSKTGAGFVWGVSSILMALCFLSMLILSYVANHMGYIGHDLPPVGILIAALLIFSVLGFPLAITYSVPYALISTRIESLGLGQGLSMGVLNLAIVIPQVLVSVGSGPWDQLFGGGNSPAFAVAAVASLMSGLMAILAIPRSTPQKTRALP